MRLKNLRLKLKGIGLRRFLIGNGRRKSRKPENGKSVSSWMMHVSHGYHVVELDGQWRTGTSVREFDSVIVQREQIQQSELWFFGVFDDGVGEVVTKYMQSHFFDKMPKESQMRKKSKEAMKRAHVSARAKLKDRDEAEEEARKWGSASAMVINGEKLVMANMGDYRAVICRDGEAYQISRKRQQPTTRHWSLKLISGALRGPRKVQKQSGESSTSKKPKNSEIVVGSESIDSETEFVILASTGVWEVMRHQEAVNLIRHIEDPQRAAECLATEALTRMTKSNISCLVIRFE
ncbi:hypothetical protein BUALT_Bualt14G0117500 [Buddleja alternifolia]|uniref:PPM-type phosphatase domain-containing protein n=1 Tax=Buddleja alternifolia TaxID=168488 RepID=A0AAV6WJU2_9LAMI|nr:hypothetical protein BUALT_Bualt14G0117500 [Buddleja alternifolia]